STCTSGIRNFSIVRRSPSGGAITASLSSIVSALGAHQPQPGGVLRPLLDFDRAGVDVIAALVLLVGVDAAREPHPIRALCIPPVLTAPEAFEIVGLNERGRRVRHVEMPHEAAIHLVGR